ncbi:MAG: beta-ketoacyl-[acyl-carrier-protein] synthase family protein [Kiritimatiellales bacterium]|nr:beta-ketoacyl-[acyl-carrier-protein] synthase family protein [Kiritimatiellales bacterium]
MIKSNRVVITGLGILAANGIGKEAFWKTLLAGESGIGPITLFDASKLGCRIAGEVSDFNPRDYIDAKYKPQRMARFTQLTLAATRMALDDAAVHKDLNGSIVPVIFGVSTSAAEVIETQVLRINKRGADSCSPNAAISSLPQAAAGAITNLLGINTQAMTVSTGCPAGLDAIALAADRIRTGKADVAITGGADAPITELTVATFNMARMISKNNAVPHKASRPFDLLRDGGVIAEGAGVIILENLEHARARGATIYVEISGFGCGGDPPGGTPGEGLATSMQTALANAGKRAEDIDHISAHGPSDEDLDFIETKMIKKVFGNRAYAIPVNSIKGATGNPLAAAGAQQLIACALSMTRNVIPPTTNYENPDPLCDLDYIPRTPRKMVCNSAMINNHGFGGSNSSLIVERVDSCRF